MKSACLLILASLCCLTVSDGQLGISAAEEEDTERGTTIDDIILQRAESLLLRSILNKLQGENGQSDALLSRSEWVTKRQHPGKRFSEDVEKRQHPGRREEEEEEEQEVFGVQRRQHPGKREEETRTGLQKRQHPGRRAAAGRLSDTPLGVLSDLSKRQHPGRRHLVLHSKRQHPGKRSLEEEEEEEEGDSDWTADGDDEELSELQQHPGRRLWDNSIPELSSDSPCDVLDPGTCRKSSLLLDFLDNIKSHGEEKRQHPGKRFAPEQDIEGGE